MLPTKTCNCYRVLSQKFVKHDLVAQLIMLNISGYRVLHIGMNPADFPEQRVWPPPFHDINALAWFLEEVAALQQRLLIGEITLENLEQTYRQLLQELRLLQPARKE